MSDFTDKMARLQAIHRRQLDPENLVWKPAVFKRILGLIIYLLLDLHFRLCELEEPDTDEKPEGPLPNWEL